jgi:geranylgeranyl pyrophosphate synthase
MTLDSLGLARGSSGQAEEIAELGGPVLLRRMARAEARLEEIAASAGAPLGRHAESTIRAGGKRLRPLLVFVAGGALSGGEVEEEPLVRAAVAVELVHSATLVHDDIVDGAAMRRGRPTVVAVAGRGMAIACGDVLFSRAFAELARNGSAEQLSALSRASSALAEGELLQREDAYAAEVALDRYLHRCELKTGRLFEAACRLGALAAPSGAGSDAGSDAGPDAGSVAAAAVAGNGRGALNAEDRAASLAAYGRRIGLAFQLLDDVLDVSGPASRTGKHRGTDLLDGTVTLPLILARERDPQIAATDLRQVRTPQAAEELCQRIEATGALAQAKARALELVARAKVELPIGLPARERRLLDRVADGVVERYQ